MDAGAFERVKQRIEELARLKVVAGWLPSSVYPTGEHVASIAAQNEFGNPDERIPARPFIRPAIADHKEEWGQAAGEMAKAVMDGSVDAMTAMGAVGAKISADIQGKISDVFAPPLSKKTLELRQLRGNTSTKPLIDTGYMHATCTHEVRED